jgi:hypothetical protein
VAFSGLSALRLRHGLLPGQALADAEQALKKHRSEPSDIELGAREIDPRHKPELAGFHWRAGMAMLAIENPSSAVGYIRRASELDPEGYYGGLATQRLRQHSLDVGHPGLDTGC